MPFYNFKCTECENEQPNELVKMGTTEIKCNSCGGKSEKTLSYNFSATGLPNGHITFRGGVKNYKK